MPSVADLINEELLSRLSSPSNFRLGREIAERGGVELAESAPEKAVVNVTPPGGVRRRVTLTSSAEGLKWKCTCTSRADLFCKHCVAAGLVIGNR